MNEGQIKIKILMIQAVDWILTLSVIAIGIYAVFYSENQNLMITYFIIGLVVVNRVGAVTLNKIAMLRMEMRKLQHKEKAWYT